METACIYCGRTIENTSIWKNKTFCSEKCKKKHKMSDLKKRGRRRR